MKTTSANAAILITLVSVGLLAVLSNAGRDSYSAQVSRVASGYNPSEVPMFVWGENPANSPATATLVAKREPTRTESRKTEDISSPPARNNPAFAAASVAALLSAKNSPTSDSVKTNAAVMPAVEARAALIQDPSLGRNYLSFNETNRWPLASLTKLMTAAVAMRNMDLVQTVDIREESLLPEAERSDGPTYINAGERYSLKDLLGLALVGSDNNAANAVASAYGYGQFIEAMNKLAGEWGLRDTHFNDPTGLSVMNQSTPDDLAVLVQRIRTEHPEIWEMTRHTSWRATDLAHKNKKISPTTNRFAGRPEFLGGKTGFTEDAQGNLITLFEYRERPVLIIILGSEDRFGETTKLWNWFRSHQAIGG